MSSSSEEDDGMTLAELMAKSRDETKKNSTSKDKSSKEVEEDSSSSSEDEGLTLADLMRNVKEKSGNQKQEDSSSSSSSEDSDDGLSLADLRKKMQKKSKKRARPSSGKKKKTKKQKKKSAAATAPAGGQRRIVQRPGVLLKNQLVESVLVRWNYCKELKWPVLKDGLKKVPDKKGYIELRGFPAVLVGVREPHIGKIIDFRDHSKSPSFDNLIRFESEKLKELAKEAIETQIEILEADNADHSKLLKNLRAEMKDILRVSSKKWDNQWKRDGW